ncbi:hypothetical protein [Fluviicola taffensis]|uniref:Polyketide cyclase/dehydrase n=1 Tax=Fluviicola taffensis (strain DSM 16823 / NCIMB 13979 / RW262) TaxID=755732 RepID=F2IE64_FLUTR|nr:hypothetical protein [Fluviicola taffensis]AEA42382.1 hypothetical protein Fluta_0374 [Fluviicola taffensis DSM 16823]
MKQYLGLIFSAIYGLLIRVVSEFDFIEINSLSYLIVAPMIMGFIPFYFKDNGYRKSWAIAVFFPLLAVILYLITAVISGLEDLICFFIIGLPYVFFSVVMSIIFYQVLKKKDKIKDDDSIIDRLSVPLLLLPILLGQIEKQFPKHKTEHIVSNEIIINQPDSVIWKNLFAVPDLRIANSSSFLNSFIVPQPTHSTYDPKTNTRLGYFENGIVLNESVMVSENNKKLTFAINLEKSKLSSSPTFDHVLKNKSLQFEYIGYELNSLKNGNTVLKLTTKYTIHSNIPFYGKMWSTSIVNEFEQNLLRSLKKVLEPLR